MNQIPAQPAETAPRDGTHFLAVNTYNSFGYYGGMKVPAYAVVHWHHDGFYMSDYGVELQHQWPFTHWYALPPMKLQGIFPAKNL